MHMHTCTRTHINTEREREIKRDMHTNTQPPTRHTNTDTHLIKKHR